MTPLIAFLLLPVMIVLLQLGHRFRLRRKTESQSNAIEGALFALFGLLLAFTFSGAVDRYDAHRELVVEESNDIGTAYLRLDLLPPRISPRCASYSAITSLRAYTFMTESRPSFAGH